MKENQLVISEDGSHTLFSGEYKEHYHSIHGAIRESRHIFLEAGLHFVHQKVDQVNLLEIGFGTGLNALLSCLESEALQLPTTYVAIEPFPINSQFCKSLNYPLQLSAPSAQLFFNLMHDAAEGQEIKISDYFHLRRLKLEIKDFSSENDIFHLVYFDAFSPETQPEMWTEEVFNKLFSFLKPGGCLVTYSCKGIVKRALRSAGFEVHKLPGPPGKREILRAIKPFKSI
jgi:tRNA U34 5-methylaminomethyl-2-thiouridine-forming methyltransferase MnmC